MGCFMLISLREKGSRPPGGRDLWAGAGEARCAISCAPRTLAAFFSLLHWRTPPDASRRLQTPADACRRLRTPWRPMQIGGCSPINRPINPPRLRRPPPAQSIQATTTDGSARSSGNMATLRGYARNIPIVNSLAVSPLRFGLVSRHCRS